MTHLSLHCKESAGQNTFSLKSEEVFVKENYILSTERVICLTQFYSDLKIELRLEFVFKGKGTRTQLTPLKGVHYQQAPKGSHRTEQILGVIDSH